MFILFAQERASAIGLSERLTENLNKKYIIEITLQLYKKHGNNSLNKFIKNVRHTHNKNIKRKKQCLSKKYIKIMLVYKYL